MARINMETLEKAIAARADGTHAPEPVSEVIARGRRGIFNLFDKDRSGRIDTFKLGACFSVLGIEYNADLLKVGGAAAPLRRRFKPKDCSPSWPSRPRLTWHTSSLQVLLRHFDADRNGTLEVRSRWRGAP